MIAHVVVFCFILHIFSLILMPKSNTKEAGFQHASAYSVVNEPKNTIDVLIIGTSQAYCSFIPLEIWENTGITSYLCSTPSQPLYYAEEFLHTACKTQSPKLVVLETDMFFEKFNEINILMHHIENTFPLIKYHNRWKDLRASDFVLEYDHSRRHLGKGFIYDYRHNEIDYSPYMIPTDEVQTITDYGLYYLERIVKFCKKKDIKLVFVSSPSAANWNYSKHNAIVQLSDKYNIEYVDTNLSLDEINLNWDTDWLDEGKHLNYYGALKFTNWFEKYLESFDFLHNKRSDPAYTFWNEDVQTVNKETELNKTM